MASKSSRAGNAILHKSADLNELLNGDGRVSCSVFQWVSAREKFQLAADLIDAEQRMKKSMWGQFWSAHQRFFKYLCIASKVKRVVQLAREEIKNGKVSAGAGLSAKAFDLGTVSNARDVGGARA